MKVFGVGMHKTGTKTLGVCLRHLGYKHTSFSLELLKQVKSGDFTGVFLTAEEYDSFEDWPWPLIYKQLDERYPDSKSILTIRRDSRTWINSLLKHAERTGPTEARELVYGYAMPHGYKDEHIAIYEAHNREVIEYFKGQPDKLLVVCWETGSGWKELCSFLNKDIPDTSFPHANRAPKINWRHWRNELKRFFGFGIPERQTALRDLVE